MEISSVLGKQQDGRVLKKKKIVYRYISVAAAEKVSM